VSFEKITPNRAFHTAGRQINEKQVSSKPSMIIEGDLRPNSLTIEEVDAIAYHLVDKFRNPGGLKFYQKAAWHIPLGTIDRLVAISFERGSNPSRYFTTLVKQELAK
jgi:hypothetical protein